MAEIRVDIPRFPDFTAEQERVLLLEAGEAVANTARLSFANSSTPTGERWVALSEVTVKQRRGGSSTPLRDTGRLMNSILVSAAMGGVLVGSNLVYSNIHNYGGMTGRGHKTRIPQRRYMPDPDNMPVELSAELSEITTSHIRAAFDGSRSRGVFGRLFGGLFR